MMTFIEFFSTIVADHIFSISLYFIDVTYRKPSLSLIYQRSCESYLQSGILSNGRFPARLETWTNKEV